MTRSEQELYDGMISARVERYGCTREEAERAGAAFWSGTSADARLALDAGCRTLEEFIIFFKGKGGATAPAGDAAAETNAMSFKIRRFILAGVLDAAAITNTSALVDAARRVPLNEWSDCIYEAEDGRFYEATPQGEIIPLSIAAVRLRLHQIAREECDPEVYAAVFRPDSARPDGRRDGLAEVLASLLQDALAVYTISDVRAALDEIERGHIIPPPEAVHCPECRARAVLEGPSGFACDPAHGGCSMTWKPEEFRS